jgi:hypothetical protein
VFPLFAGSLLASTFDISNPKEITDPILRETNSNPKKNQSSPKKNQSSSRKSKSEKAKPTS